MLDDEIYLVVGASFQLWEVLEGLGEAYKGQTWMTYWILECIERWRGVVPLLLEEAVKKGRW